jgi:hypothetical protein
MEAEARFEARAERSTHERRSVFRMYCSTATEMLPFDDNVAFLSL